MAYFEEIAESLGNQLYPNDIVLRQEIEEFYETEDGGTKYSFEEPNIENENCDTHSSPTFHNLETVDYIEEEIVIQKFDFPQSDEFLSVPKTGLEDEEESFEPFMFTEPATSSTEDVEATDPDTESNLKLIPTKKRKKGEKYKCPSCDFDSIFKHTLKYHIDSVHLKLKVKKCKLCDHSTTGSGGLKYHMRAAHGKGKHEKCDLCDYKAVQHMDLKRHIDAVHLKLKNFKCNFCDYATYRNNILKSHIHKVHLKEHRCSLCDFSTWEKENLRLHMKNFHSKSKIKHCYKGNITNHVNSSNLKIGTHNCEECDYSSTRKRKLEVHVRSAHSKKEIYNCDLCKFNTSRRNVLNDHVDAVHLQKMDDKCEIHTFSVSEEGVLTW